MTPKTQTTLREIAASACSFLMAVSAILLLCAMSADTVHFFFLAGSLAAFVGSAYGYSHLTTEKDTDPDNQI